MSKTRLRWLQWGTMDLRSGLGGVEVHARSLARELDRLGVDVELSMNPSDLSDPQWDVIHTHGSSSTWLGHSRAIRAHTLHGTTLGRMEACGEWTWPGGYAAFAREIRGVMKADVVLGVNPELSLLSLARRLGKVTRVCWNGWDPSDLPGLDSSLSQELREKLRTFQPFWIFVGRGEDRMKGADRLLGTMKLAPDIRWVAAPGRGFEDLPSVTPTGILNSSQIRELMNLASGLILPSRYEGHSLVLLEALAQGLPVVATKVGGVPVLPEGLEGLVISDSGDPRSLADAIRAATKYSTSSEARFFRAEKNRQLLPNWKKVAEISLQAVQESLAKRKS